jgi:hypothetical protein
MSAPPRKDEPGLTRRDELAVSGAALSEVPWKTATGAGVVVAGGDLLLHLSTLHVGLGSSLSAGVVAFGAVAGAGVVLKDRPSRAVRWARRNPWRFAVLPGAATAIIVYVLSVIIGSSGMIGGGFTALWHGAIAFGVTGAAGAIAGGRRRST